MVQGLSSRKLGGNGETLPQTELEVYGVEKTVHTAIQTKGERGITILDSRKGKEIVIEGK